MRALLKNYKQQPRKVRVVADLVRGKKVDEALFLLSFADKRAADPIAKLLKSAIANAKENKGLSEENLYVKEITVQKGITLKRFMPVSRGRAHPINRRRSHIQIILSEKTKSENKKPTQEKIPTVKEDKEKTAKKTKKTKTKE
jgi:large subunit ribosomal protein L22